ncbi:MAG: sulfotransferase [Pseudomonadota bacterium]
MLNRRVLRAPIVRENPDKNLLESRGFFVGIGAMRCGTTWLSSYLMDHPEFFHSPVKEMNFFNTLCRNPHQKKGPPFRRQRIERLTIEQPFLTQNGYKWLYDLIELGSFDKDLGKYLNYFRKRIGDEPFYGEISPSYALISARTYKTILNISDRVRIAFLMRDPASRTISHFGHQKRKEPSADLNKIIEDLSPNHPMYLQSDYTQTLDILMPSVPAEKRKVLFYEEFISEAGMRDVCDFIGISYRKPDLGKRTNENKQGYFDEDQYARVRKKLKPIYAAMSERYPEQVERLWNYPG